MWVRRLRFEEIPPKTGPALLLRSRLRLARWYVFHYLYRVNWAIFWANRAICLESYLCCSITTVASSFTVFLVQWATKLHNNTLYVGFFFTNVVRLILLIFFNNYEHLQVATIPSMKGWVFSNLLLLIFSLQCRLLNHNGLLPMTWCNILFAETILEEIYAAIFSLLAPVAALRGACAWGLRELILIRYLVTGIVTLLWDLYGAAITSIETRFYHCAVLWKWHNLNNGLTRVK